MERAWGNASCPKMRATIRIARTETAMINGTSQMSFIRRNGWKAIGMAVVAAGLVLGGCNNKVKEENEALSKENAELREKVSSIDSQNAQTQQQLTQLQSDNARLQAELAAKAAQPVAQQGGDNWGGGGNGGQIVRPGAQTNTIEISSDVLFGSGSATLKPEARKELDKYMTRLKSASAITIEGHTDTDPIRKSKWGSNQALSKARADAVRDYLASRGVSRSKIDTVGKGSSEPKSTKAKSRRVDIVVVE